MSYNVDIVLQNTTSAPSEDTQNQKNDASSSSSSLEHISYLSVPDSDSQLPNLASSLHHPSQNQAPKFIRNISLASPENEETPETLFSQLTNQLETKQSPSLIPLNKQRTLASKVLTIEEDRSQVRIMSPDHSPKYDDDGTLPALFSPLSSPGPLLSQKSRGFYREVGLKAIQRIEQVERELASPERDLETSPSNGRRRGLKDLKDPFLKRHNSKMMFHDIMQTDVELCDTEYNLVNDRTCITGGDHHNVSKKKAGATPRRQHKLKQLLEKHSIVKPNVKTEFVRRLINKLDQSKKNKVVLFFQHMWGSMRRMKIVVRHIKAFGKNLCQVWRPQSKKKIIWNLVSAIFTVYEIIFIPFYIGFEYEPIGDAQNFEFAKDMFFFLDVLVNFHSAYVSHGVCYTDHRLIAKRYLRTWFTTDLIANIPYVEIATLANKGMMFGQNYGGSSWKNSKYLRLLRIFRWIKVRRTISQFQIRSQSQVQNGILDLFLLLLYIIMMAHWIACAWHFVGFSVPDADVISWLARNDLYDLSLAERYIASLYWAITTMLTVGYGDITPNTLLERIVNIICMLVGCAMFAYSMNKVGILLQSIEMEQSKKMQKYYLITNYMKRKSVSKEMQTKVDKYLSYLFENKNELVSEEQSALNLLSDTLQSELRREINGKTLRENLLFQIIFGSRFLVNLSNNLEEKIFSPNEVIFDETDTQFAIYFISAGNVELYYNEAHMSLATLKRGSHFGELSFFTDRPRLVTAKSITFSSIFCISKSKFLSIIENYQTEKEAYHVVRDKIILYNNYHAIKIKCYACGKEGHYAKVCPNTHCVLDTEHVIKEYIITEKEFCRSYKRSKARPKFHAVGECYYLEFQAQRFVEEKYLDLEKFNGQILLRFKSQLQKKNKMTIFTFADYMLKKKGSRKESIHDKAISAPTFPRSELASISTFTESKGDLLRLKQSMPQDSSEAIQESGRDEEEGEEIKEETNEEGNEDNNIDENQTEKLAVKPADLNNFYEDPLTKYRYPSFNRIGAVDISSNDFDMVKNYEVYFPHNNIKKMIESVERETLRQLKLKQIKQSVEVMKQEMRRYSVKDISDSSFISPLHDQYFAKTKSAT